MKQNCYEVIFNATETLQNGKERTIKKSILAPIFNKEGKHITTEERVMKGTEILKEMHYYNIKYIETKCKSLIWIE